MMESMQGEFIPEEHMGYDEHAHPVESGISDYEPAAGESASDTLTQIPKGYFYKDSYRAPEVAREQYIELLHEQGVANRYQDFTELGSRGFLHTDRSLTIDFYRNDFKKVLKIFKKYYGEESLLVTNGFRSPHEIGVAPHSTGIAIDLHAKDKIQARRIMNAAYLAGIPTIIPNGEFHLGEGYVHLDIAPTADYAYDAGIYKGPWMK